MYMSKTSEIYVSVKSGGAWGVSMLLPPVINDPVHNVVRRPWITNNGSRLFFSNDSGYSYSDKVGGEWQTPQLVQIDLSDFIYSSHHFCFSPGWIRFVVQWCHTTDDQVASMDIYQSHFNGSSWSRPVPFVEVNSVDYNEMGMAISGDGNTFYSYTIERPEITGSYSIWVTCKVGGVWQEPVLMGPTINMTDYEERYTPAVSYDGSIFYFSTYSWGGVLPYGIFMSSSTLDP